MSPDNDRPESEEEKRRRAPLEPYEIARARRAEKRRQSQSAEPERSKFALILNELEERSKTSSRWLTGMSFVYLAVIVFLVAILYLRYSDIGKLVAQLEGHLDETDGAIAEQASVHEEQSKVITGRIDSAGVVLNGLDTEFRVLEGELDEGMEKAAELHRESDNLQAKIAEVDRLLEKLAKRAEPFYVHYAIDPDKPLRYGRERSLDIVFDDQQLDPLFAPSENVEREGRYLIPESGTYMVTGWFATGYPEEEREDETDGDEGEDENQDPPKPVPVVETEIRVDGQPYWTGFSYGTGIFTSGVPLRRGQVISIHATVRSPGERDSPSGTIDRGEMRIARLYHAPE